jgi:cbb3-type cytochrome oxidase subunit 3
MKGQDYKPTGMEKLIAQWPGFVGLLLLAIAGAYYLYAKNTPPHTLYVRPFIGLIVAGIVFLGYWALANRDGSNY